MQPREAGCSLAGSVSRIANLKSQGAICVYLYNSGAATMVSEDPRYKSLRKAHIITRVRLCSNSPPPLSAPLARFSYCLGTSDSRVPVLILNTDLYGTSEHFRYSEGLHTLNELLDQDQNLHKNPQISRIRNSLPLCRSCS